VQLPRAIPPSYRGEAITYTYQVSIGAQQVGQPAELIKIPFRVLPVSGKVLQTGCGDAVLPCLS
jgi:hypothetical protein